MIIYSSLGTEDSHGITCYYEMTNCVLKKVKLMFEIRNAIITNI